MNPYASVAEFKASSGLQSTADDTHIQLCLDAAAAALEGYCNRAPLVADAVATAREYAVLTMTGWHQIDECVAVTLVEIRSSASESWFTLSEYTVAGGGPFFPRFGRPPYSWLYRDFGWPSVEGLPTLRVTARWGYSEAVPHQVKLAVIGQATRWFKRGQSSWADTLASDAVGQLFFRRDLDPDIAMMLRNARLVRPTLG